MLNQLINEQVTHKIFGVGIIIFVKSREIAIHFLTDESNKNRYFHFPASFLGDTPFLTTDSKYILDLLIEEKEKNVCSQCNKYYEEMAEVDGLKICPDCFKTLTFCGLCEHLINAGDNYEKIDDSFIICENCIRKNYFKCFECNEYCNNKLGVSSRFLFDGKLICDNCADQLLELFCHVCGELLPEDVGVYIDFKTICPDCAKEHIFNCFQCGEESIRVKDAIDDLCETCIKKKNYLDFVINYPLKTKESLTFPFRQFREMRTRTIMSRLRHSYDKFVLDDLKAEHQSIDVLYLTAFGAKFVIIYDLPLDFQYLNKASCTLTDLKKTGLYFLYSGDTCRISKEVSIDIDEFFYIWEVPYKLHAQTISDMYYGDHWYWAGKNLNEVIEGNKYGDTSSFYILGYISKKN
ncbi:MAG: hypothetical protein GX638_04205 [Crenarchaeota archaeon]|nr:hypothetical protein [Thermoproteota archaeon]